jgi:hypothetical protein
VWWPFRQQKSHLLVYRAAVRRYRLEVRRMQEAGAQAEDDFAGPFGEVPERPVLDRLVCVDTAVETLAQILEGNKRGTLVARADLDSWLLPFTHHRRKDVGRDVAAWSEMFLAGMLCMDHGRDSARFHFVRRAAVSVTGLLRPDTLARILAADGPAAGLVVRLVLAMPPTPTRSWTEVKADEKSELAYRDLTTGLRALQFESEEDDLNPHALKLSPGARAAWAKFYDGCQSAKADEDDSPLSAALSELESYAARFALLHHVVSRIAKRESDLVPVERVSIDAGVALSRWCATETRRIYASLLGSAEERRVGRLLAFIRRCGGRCTVRDLMRSNVESYPNTTAATAALEGLVSSGLARWA